MSKERYKSTMPTNRRRHRRGIFTAYLALMTVVITLDVTTHLATILILLWAIPLGYVIGRTHQYRIMMRSGKHTLNQSYGAGGTTLLTTPEPDDSEPVAYYGGQWNPKDGYQPLDRVSAYPKEYQPCSPGHCNYPTGCFAPNCYGKRTTRADILRDPRSGAHDSREGE